MVSARSIDCTGVGSKSSIVDCVFTFVNAIIIVSGSSMPFPLVSVPIEGRRLNEDGTRCLRRIKNQFETVEITAPAIAHEIATPARVLEEILEDTPVGVPDETVVGAREDVI